MKKFYEVFMLGFVALVSMVWYSGVTVERVEAGNYGMSTKGDSTIVTYTHHVNADSAHCAFRYGGKDLATNAYDSIFLYPVGGGVDGIHLIADDYLDLDSIGAHTVMITVFDGGAIIDTTFGVWVHDVANQDLNDMIYDIVAYWGACDSCYQIMWPRDGSSNKDSMWVIDPSRGDDSLVGMVRWHHSNVPSVYDSSYFYFDEPWE